MTTQLFEDRAAQRLRGFFKTDAACQYVVAMLAALRTTQRVQRGKIDDSTSAEVPRMLINLTVIVFDNPFYQQFGGKLTPLFQAAVVAWIDSGRYLNQLGGITDDTPRDEKTMRLVENAQACARTYREFVVQAMLCEGGVTGGLTQTLELRKALDELMEQD